MQTQQISYTIRKIFMIEIGFNGIRTIGGIINSDY